MTTNRSGREGLGNVEPTETGIGLDPRGSRDSATPTKPVHEVRLGRIKGTIWANSTEAGMRHNVTVRRLYKRDGSAAWEQSDSFGRDDLPQVAEVVRMAWLWIFANAQQS